ncbi:uncharacterized protein LOC109921235 [Rhincodon typus]|uniref:uncharacterized protein LOC109921235 n=1 Tax=Rhincodon typus TaxID=259920 RepID=UPI00202F0DFB|nr:uncharacterized protein LOC109921235 [Rhincodon typus]
MRQKERGGKLVAGPHLDWSDPTSIRAYLPLTLRIPFVLTSVSKGVGGLNDAPVCKVDDFVPCSKEPSKPPTPKQEFIKPLRPITANIPITVPYPAHVITGVPQPPCKDETQPDISFLYSQAWREELRDLTARVEFTPEPTSEAKEEENAKWVTQYPAEKGSLCTSPIRPKSRPASRPGSRAGASECARPTLTVAEREVLVLELLSQILQTDSLQAVQQWLLITGQKDKDMVLDLLRMAVANMKFNSSNTSTCATGKDNLTSRQPAEETEVDIFRAQSACERRRARSQCQCQRLDSILEKEPDRERDLKMLEDTRPLSSVHHCPRPKICKKPKTLGVPKRVPNVTSSPILDGKLCHSKTDLSKT